MEKFADLKLRGALCKDEFHMLNNNILRKILNPELETNYEKVEENHIKSNPVHKNNNICSISKCESNNPMTYLYCKFCDTKL